MADHYELVVNSPSTAALDEFDLDRLSLRSLLTVRGEKRQDINRDLLNARQDLVDQGFQFADCRVLEVLLNSWSHIPDSWQSIGDTERLANDTGIIRFEGTVLRGPPDSFDKVATLSYSRGRWEAGFDSLGIDQGTAGQLRETGGWHFRLYTVVYLP